VLSFNLIVAWIYKPWIGNCHPKGVIASTRSTTTLARCGQRDAKFRLIGPW